MAEKTNYFRLRTSGWGYINKIRSVEPDNALPFTVVEAVLLQGPQSNPERLRVSAIVSGEDAYRALTRVAVAMDGGKRIFAHLVLAGMRIKTFVYQKGERAGQTGVNVHSHLVDILKAKADGIDLPLNQESSEPTQAAA